MNKRHFDAMAALLRHDLDKARQSPDDYQRTYDAVKYAAHAFATVALRDNPRFSLTRFLAACGLRGQEVD